MKIKSINHLLNTPLSQFHDAIAWYVNQKIDIAKWQAYLSMLLLPLMLCLPNKTLFFIDAFFLLCLQCCNIYQKHSFKSPIFIKVFIGIALLGIVDVFIQRTPIRELVIPLKILACTLWYYLIPAIQPCKFYQQMCVTLIGMGIYANYQYFLIGLSRINGNSNAINYSNFAAIVLVLIWVYALHMGVKKNFGHFVHGALFIVSNLSALMVIVLSGTRSNWLILAICAMYLSIQYMLNIKYRKVKNNTLIEKENKNRHTFLWVSISIFLSVCLFVLIQQLAWPIIHQRFLDTVEEWQQIQSGNWSGSFGLRLAMWQASIHFIYQHPWGVGLQNFYQDLYIPIREAGKLPISSIYVELHHPHNDFFWFAVQWGIAGIAAYCALFGSLWKFFNKRKSIVGKVFILAWMIAGLTQSLFAHSSAIIFFGVVLALLTKLKMHYTHRENE